MGLFVGCLMWLELLCLSVFYDFLGFSVLCFCDGRLLLRFRSLGLNDVFYLFCVVL